MTRIIGTSLLLLLLLRGAGAQSTETIVVDGSAPSHPFPHFWEQMFGSGRAVLSLRESYRHDLQTVKQVTDFRYIRFHAIFHDELGVYDEDQQGRPVFNFSYIDQIYDGLLANGVRPFVEMSFMPNKLVSTPIIQAFWYKPDVAPPKDWGKWDELITKFTTHLVEHYGIDEVSQWYFEVWNEPNLDFWGGEPKQSTYWELYDHTAKAVKAVNSRLRIGGPATAQAAWADAFIEHCFSNHIPVDFISTHVYGNDKAQDVFRTEENIPRDKMVCRAVKKVHDQIAASSTPKLPLIWSEFNASYFNEPAVTDAAYMGPWLGEMIRQCDGLVDVMSYWTFSDVFEEQGVIKTPFYGGFGLLAEGGIPKPAFNAFKLLHELGDQRIDANSDSALITKKKEGGLVIAVWNYAPPEQRGEMKTVILRFQGGKYKRALLSMVDPEHGDVHSAYEKMGSPVNPTQAQIQKLKDAAQLPPASEHDLKMGELTLTLPSYGLALVQVK
ncbi:MAG TPA: glycosyl hydrolase family 39 [Candidatus Sulfotelmatobacter sp.]